MQLHTLSTAGVLRAAASISVSIGSSALDFLPFYLGLRAANHCATYGYGYTRGSGTGRVGLLATGRVRVRVEKFCHGSGRVAKVLYPQTPNQHTLKSTGIYRGNSYLTNVLRRHK